MRLILGRRGMARYLAEAERRHEEDLDVACTIAEDAIAQVEACHRDHTDLARRNGELQATNIRLAHQLERSELLRAEAEHHIRILTVGRGA